MIDYLCTNYSVCWQLAFHPVSKSVGVAIVTGVLIWGFLIVLMIREERANKKTRDKFHD